MSQYADLSKLTEQVSKDAKLSRAKPIEILGDEYPWLPPTGSDFEWFKDRYGTDLLTYLSRVEQQFNRDDADIEMGQLRPLLCGLLYLGLRHFGDLDYETVEELVGLGNMMQLFGQIQGNLNAPEADPQMQEELEESGVDQGN